MKLCIFRDPLTSSIYTPTHITHAHYLSVTHTRMHAHTHVHKHIRVHVCTHTQTILDYAVEILPIGCFTK